MNRNKFVFGIALAFLFLSLLTLLAGKSPKQEDKYSYSNIKTTVTPQPEELGKVKWIRLYDQAVTLANETDKPILILFQEVPGCATCRNYGNNALSHPLIVEAIESLFVPLAIYNNKPGADAQILQMFGEPSWNNPVVRIVNADKRALTPRLGGDYSNLGLITAMITALTVNGSVVPPYLTLLQDEFFAKSTGTETATVGMYCFWTGEKELGSLDGVVSTQPGFMGGREVVTVEFNPEVIDYKEVLSQAKKVQCASHVYAEDSGQKEIAGEIIPNHHVSDAKAFRLDSKPKYYLSKTIYRYLPMTSLQATKANAFIGKRQSPTAILSPRQLELAAFIKENKNLDWEVAINQPFEKRWDRAMNLCK